MMYGAEGTSLSFGSTINGNRINTDLFNNATDIFGLGITYKFIDADLNVSLPQTRLAKEDRENLNQVKLILSSSGRKLSIRGLFSDQRRLINEDENSDFKTNPDVRVTKIVLQATYNFNSERYSYRAANFQNEYQKKSAVAFLLRFEPSYRYLKAPEGFVPQKEVVTATALYGDQAAIQYIQGPCISLLPGIGWNYSFANTRFFFSPILMAGPGLSVNNYTGYSGAKTKLNYDLSAFAVVNVGYNGLKTYITFRLAQEGTYSSLDPSYLTNSNLRGTISIGYRFSNLEKFIPTW